MAALTLLTLATALPDLYWFLLDFSDAGSSCCLPSTSLKPPPPPCFPRSPGPTLFSLGLLCSHSPPSFPSLSFLFPELTHDMIPARIMIHRPPCSPLRKLQDFVTGSLKDIRGPTPLVLDGQGHKPYLLAPLPRLFSRDQPCKVRGQLLSATKPSPMRDLRSASLLHFHGHLAWGIVTVS